MASGRFLSTSVAEDDRLSKLSMAAELLYLKTIPHLDRDGMISGKAGLLWGKVCPLREELISEMQRAIDAWVQVGLVVRMITDEGPVLFFPGFLKNNNLPHYHRERPSRYPVPTGYVRMDSGLILEGTEPPKKQPKKTQAPPSSNGNAEPVLDEVQESINDEVLDKFMDELNDEVQELALQEQEEDQEEDQEKAAARAHTRVSEQGKLAAFLPDADADKDGRFTMQLVSDENLFGLFRSDAKKRAAALEETYKMEDIRRGIALMVERHNAMVDRGERGVQDAIGFLAKLMRDEFKTADDKQKVKVEVRLAPSEYYPNGHTVYDTMTMASARQSGFKIVELLQ